MTGFRIVKKWGVGLLFFVLLQIAAAGAWGSQGGYSEDKGTLGPYESPVPVDGAGKKLLAIYMVGSDLESNGDNGTLDFKELIQGYQSLENKNLTIIAAFGGSAKDGWKGMKFASLEQIIQDANDGSFGNEAATSYLYTAEGAHMGDKSSLKLFLDYLKEGYSGHDSSFLVFWDHGGAYTGFGNDENFNSDALSLAEISGALSESGIAKFNLIGFDACLMGSLEVARFVKPYTQYLLGSEELEPGHGWNWTSVIQQYSTQESVVQAAKNIIDNFVQNVHSYQSDGKTLSLADMSKFDALAGQVDKFAALFSENMTSSEYSAPLIHGSTKSREYGKQSKEDQRMSVDLKNMAELIKGQLSNSDAIADMENLIAAIDDYVVYTKNDGTRPNSNGVTIAPPENTDASMNEFKLGSTWLSFQSAFAGLRAGDTTNPVVQEVNTDADSSDFEFDSSEGGEWYAPESYNYSSFTQIESSPAGHTLPFMQGERAAFVSSAGKGMQTSDTESDDTSDSSVKGTSATFVDENLVSVSTIFGFEFNADLDNPEEMFFMTVAELEAYQTTTQGQYFTPMWNKKWYCIEYDPNAEMTEWMPMMFDSRYTIGDTTYTEYTAEIDYYQNGKDYSGYDYPADMAILRIKVDEQNNVVNHSVQTYKLLFSGPDDEVGSVLLDKATRKITAGDKIQFFTYAYSLDSPENSGWFETGDVITFTQDPKFTLEVLEFEDDNGELLIYKYAMRAKDVSGNESLTDLAVAKLSSDDDTDSSDDDSGTPDDDNNSGGGSSGPCFIAGIQKDASVLTKEAALLGALLTGSLLCICFVCLNRKRNHL